MLGSYLIRALNRCFFLSIVFFQWLLFFPTQCIAIITVIALLIVSFFRVSYEEGNTLYLKIWMVHEIPTLILKLAAKRVLSTELHETHSIYEQLIKLQFIFKIL